ncbi:MAG TPA: hypothetical protein PKD55_13905 [Bellilinea sp.]|jgi:hypothetical protein|nr:hypothetical protein [Bellilinea sp.]
MGMRANNIRKLFSGLSETRRFLLVGGIGTYALAFSEYLSVPRAHSGRWAWLLNWAIDTLGEYGVVYLWAALGTFLIAKALMWKKETY